MFVGATEQASENAKETIAQAVEGVLDGLVEEMDEDTRTGWQKFIDNMENAPQVLYAVFDGCPSQGHPEVRGDPVRRSGAFRMRVFESLRLVENKHGPGLLHQQIREFLGVRGLIVAGHGNLR